MLKIIDKLFVLCLMMPVCMGMQPAPGGNKFDAEDGILSSSDSDIMEIAEYEFNQHEAPANVLSTIHSNSSLQRISSSGNIHIEKLIIDHNKLEVLDSSNCPRLETVRINIPSLRSLNLAGCAALREVIIKTPGLEVINLSGCNNLPAAIILQLVLVVSETLRQLNIRGCSQVDPGVLIECLKQHNNNECVISLD